MNTALSRGRAMARQGLDSRLDPVRALPKSATQRPKDGWIRAVREALGMPAAGLAKRLGVAESTVLRLEDSERRGTVQLDSLERAANALGCDVVYALVPRKSLEAVVHDQATLRAQEELARITHTMALEDQSAGQVADSALLQQMTAALIDKPGLWHARRR